MEYNISLLKGIIIAKTTGEYCVDLILDESLNPVLLSSFVGALSMFGKDSVGKIEEIIIKGLDIEMIIVSEYGLVLMVILDKRLKQKGIRKEIETLLDMFYSMYKEIIEDEKRCIDTEEFKEFKQVLYFQIDDYFKKLTLEEQKDNKDFGFFTAALEGMKEKKEKGLLFKPTEIPE